MTADEPLPLPRGVNTLSAAQESLHPHVSRDAGGKFLKVTIATDGGHNSKTREGTAASTTMTELLIHAPYDPTLETASALPNPCDSSTESERIAHLQADVTFPQQIQIRCVSDSKSAIALNAKSVAIVKKPREQTVRRKITRRFQAIQTACETQIEHRVRLGHPLPTYEWVKGHVLDRGAPGAKQGPKLKDYEKNRRADSLCELAAVKPPPTVYRLMGQPDHYLRSCTDGKPLTHGPQHHMRASSQQILLRELRKHRRQGQLLRGNTSIPMVAAAAKYLGRTASMRQQDNMLTRAMTQLLPTKRELARRGDLSAHWITEDEAICTACDSPHPLDVASLVTCVVCEGVWVRARNKILQVIEKERVRHKNKPEGSKMKTIDIPDDFPQVQRGKRVLHFLDPKHPREYCLHGAQNPEHPELRPRELPCPEPTPQERPRGGERATAEQIGDAYESLNATNPIRTCLGAPPKQLATALGALGASTKTVQDIWARIFAPQLMTALSECLTTQNQKCGHTECTIESCARCAGSADETLKRAKRKRRRLTAGIGELDG